MLEKEFEYYQQNQKKFVEKYNGRFIVIHGESVIGDYGSELEAYNESKKKYEVGTFLIQRVSPGTDNYSQSYHSRVTFPPHAA